MWRSESFCSKSLRLETQPGDRTGTHICMAGKRWWYQILVNGGDDMAVNMVCGSWGANGLWLGFGAGQTRTTQGTGPLLQNSGPQEDPW